MKLSAAQKGLLWSLGFMVLAFFIYYQFLRKKNYYVADNPTDHTYYLQINNEQKKIIAAGQSLHIDLSQGKNRFKIFQPENQLLKDTVVEVKKSRGLINLAAKPYYIYRQYYGYNLNKDSLLLTQDQISIDGKKYFGGAKEFTGTYTEDFYYNVDEDFDKVIKNIDKVESRTKIFRKQDFINYYNTIYKF